MNIFILSFDPLGTKLSSVQLLGYIQSSRHIHQWYTPFLGTYIIKSDENLLALTEKLRTQFDGSFFLLTLFHPSFIGGSMPAEVWAWINPPQAPVITVER